MNNPLMSQPTLRTILLILVLVAAVAITGVLLAHREPRGWTTDSEAALAEFERGLEDDLRIYRDEATEHFVRAAELDPDFLIARLMLLSRGAYDQGEGLAEERAEEIEEQLRSADLSRVTPRERFMIEHYFARRDDDSERADALLADYLERHPKDPFALHHRCSRQYMVGEFEAAEACFERMIEIDPNWVLAQNLLGYLAMAQGEWERAEERFAIYRYLAPDQANPHDSLGELLLLTGRLDEAREELRAALDAKANFCASWGNLVTAALLEERWAEAERIIDRTEREELCPPDFVPLQRCRLGVWRAFTAGDWTATVEQYGRPECERSYGETSVMAYQAALLAGRDEEAAALRAKTESFLEEHGQSDLPTLLLHLDGIRLRLAGRPEEAVEKLREADEELAFWNAEMGYFKLANQLELWRALSDAGHAEESERVLAELRAVNPVVAERWAVVSP